MNSREDVSLYTEATKQQHSTSYLPNGGLQFVGDSVDREAEAISNALTLKEGISRQITRPFYQIVHLSAVNLAEAGRARRNWKALLGGEFQSWSAEVAQGDIYPYTIHFQRYRSGLILNEQPIADGRGIGLSSLEIRFAVPDGRVEMLYQVKFDKVNDVSEINLGWDGFFHYSQLMTLAASYPKLCDFIQDFCYKPNRRDAHDGILVGGYLASQISLEDQPRLTISSFHDVQEYKRWLRWRRNNFYAQSSFTYDGSAGTLRRSYPSERDKELFRIYRYNMSSTLPTRTFENLVNSLLRLSFEKPKI